jgi:hypothetical protein
MVNSGRAAEKIESGCLVINSREWGSGKRETSEHLFDHATGTHFQAKDRA